MRPQLRRTVLKTVLKDVALSKTLLVATLAAVGLGGWAHAAPAPAQAVDIRGLNPSTPADARVIHDRLNRAAAQVCERMPQDMFVNASDRIENCDRPTVEAAIKTLPPSLAAALQSRPAKIRLAVAD